MEMNVEAWNDPETGIYPVSALDYLPPSQLSALQLHRLKSIVKWAYDRVSIFRQRMEERSLTPEDIRSIEDIRKLPFTTKSDLLTTYPFGMIATPMREIVRLHASSGTKNKPIVVAYTARDIQLWASVMLRTFVACGVRRGDIIQNSYSYSLFTGGLGFHYGAEALGATVVPISTGNSERQLMIMKDFQTTVICCTPSYFIHLIEQAKETKLDLKSLPLRIGLFGAEPWTESMRAYIESEAGIKAYDVYGLSEIIGPGVASECNAQDGLHVFEDHFYPEIVDPETGEVLPDGEEGELVLTTLTKQAMPMIRYRTRDITKFITTRCSCGRTLRRIARIKSRCDDMLIIRGVNVFPSQIEEALLGIDGALPHYQIVVTREGGLDELEVQVEVTKELFSDRVGALEALRQKIVYQVEKAIGLRVRVKLIEPQTLQRFQGKAKRVLDLRTQNIAENL